MVTQRLGVRHIAAIERASWGLINREIAFQLDLAARTIDGLIEEARRVMDASNRPHLVARAIELGIVDPRDWSALESLSCRQLDVARAIARGLSSADIAAELGIQHPTVATHLRRARGTTGCRTSSELAALVASQLCRASRPISTCNDRVDAVAHAVLLRRQASPGGISA